MDEATLDRQIERQRESLRLEFAGVVPESDVTTISRAHVDQLRAEARIPDFIPILAYRFTRKDLVRAAHEELHQAA